MREDLPPQLREAEAAWNLPLGGCDLSQMKPWIRHTCWLCAPPRVPFSSQRLGPPLLSLVLGAPSQPRALKAPAAPYARVCSQSLWPGWRGAGMHAEQETLAQAFHLPGGGGLGGEGGEAWETTHTCRELPEMGRRARTRTTSGVALLAILKTAATLPRHMCVAFSSRPAARGP